MNIKKIFKILVSLLGTVWVGSIIYLNDKYPDVGWDWKNINTKDMYFPKNFIWGTATAAHQVEGFNTNNNWYRWEHSFDQNGKSRIHNSDKSGDAADHWNLYKQDINLMKNIGVNAYRFSVEWSKIMPTINKIDQDAIDHYREVCIALIDSGLVPVVTLHHFTHPLWFEDLGGFEKEENIKYFLEFSELIFNELSDIVKYWCTINEPAVYVSQGYFNGVFPPGKKDPLLAGEVMKNLLYAHTEVYHLLKSLKNGDQSQIGLVKNITQFDPLRRWHVLDWYFSKILNDIFTNSTIDLLLNGEFRFYLPGMADLSYTNTKAIKALDFIGLNYYSRWHVKGHLNPNEPFTFEKRKQDIQTDMPYSIYPEGFYKALNTVSKLEMPIIVTENGIADDKDDRRKLFINRYLYALFQAMQDGLIVNGYFYWSLMDNFEWAEGYSMKFGLYEVDFSSQDRNLRDGSQAYKEIINRPAVDSRGYKVSIGDKAPDLELNMIDGTRINLSELLGQVVVLQFTASWCSVCIQEMPHLEKEVWLPFKDEGLMLIGIDRDEPLEVVKKFKKQTGITYPLALDPEANHFSKFAHKNAGVTRNVVIDKKGNIAFLTRLFDKDEFEAMKQKIKLLLKD
ncbi:MAG: family 1 glycosylhydrolase [bacterium]